MLDLALVVMRRYLSAVTSDAYEEYSHNYAFMLKPRRIFSMG